MSKNPARRCRNGGSFQNFKQSSVDKRCQFSDYFDNSFSESEYNLNLHCQVTYIVYF